MLEYEVIAMRIKYTLTVDTDDLAQNVSAGD
jgi:hypothetical protein